MITIGQTKLIKPLKTIFLILIFPTLMLAQTSDSIEKKSRPSENFYRPNGVTRIILGLSGVYGIRYGLSVFFSSRMVS